MENLDFAIEDNNRRGAGASSLAGVADWRVACLGAAARLLGLWLAVSGFVAAVRYVLWSGAYAREIGAALVSEPGWQCVLGAVLFARAARVARFFGGCVAWRDAAAALFRGGCVLLLLYLLVLFGARAGGGLAHLVLFSERVQSIFAQFGILLFDAVCLAAAGVACFMLRARWGRGGG